MFGRQIHLGICATAETRATYVPTTSLLVEVFVFERTPGLLRPQKHHHTPKQTDGSFSTSRYPPQEHLSDDHHRRRPRPRRKKEKTQLTIPSRPDPPTPPTGGRRRRRRPQLLRRPPALRAAARTAVMLPGLDGEGCGPALRRTPRLPRRAAPTPQNKTKQNTRKWRHSSSRHKTSVYARDAPHNNKNKQAIGRTALP